MQPNTTWRDLPAGPELDALVAERVLGWTLEAKAFGFETMYRWLNREGQPICIRLWKDPQKATAELPALSTTWDGMGLVVEAMEARGWEWLVSFEMGRYQASFQPTGKVCPSDHYHWPDSVWADTAPLAVSRAALAALEVGS